MTGFALSRFQVPLRPNEESGMGRGLAFAIVAHGLLFVGLSVGVAWHTSTPPAFEAELWSAVPQAAAPKAVEPPPEPEPEVKPEVVKPPQPSAEEVQAQRDAEIAIAKAKDDKKRKEQEARDKALEKKRQDDKQAAEDKKKLDQQKQDKLDKLKADKAVKDADAKREAQRQKEIDRIKAQAGVPDANGAPNSTGIAKHSSGPSSSYAGRIIARVRPKIYGDLPAGNPAADVEVRVAPDGTIIGRKLVKPSGDPDWDRRVLRAIDATEILPRDTDGSVQPLMVLTFKPRDL